MMIPHKDNLNTLANAYFKHLSHRDESTLKQYLSIDFVTRQKVTKQLRLIRTLPKFLYGISMEVQLFEEYQIQEKDNKIFISPFQFEVSYTPHMNLVEIEKITITIHSVILEDQSWKIESIISDDEKEVLMNVIDEMNRIVQV